MSDSNSGDDYDPIEGFDGSRGRLGGVEEGSYEEYRLKEILGIYDEDDEDDEDEQEDTNPTKIDDSYIRIDGEVHSADDFEVDSIENGLATFTKEDMKEVALAMYSAARYRGRTTHELDPMTKRAAESTFEQWYEAKYE